MICLMCDVSMNNFEVSDDTNQQKSVEINKNQQNSTEVNNNRQKSSFLLFCFDLDLTLDIKDH